MTNPSLSGRGSALDAADKAASDSVGKQTSS